MEPIIKGAAHLRGVPPSDIVNPAEAKILHPEVVDRPEGRHQQTGDDKPVGHQEAQEEQNWHADEGKPVEREDVWVGMAAKDHREEMSIRPDGNEEQYRGLIGAENRVPVKRPVPTGDELDKNECEKWREDKEHGIVTPRHDKARSALPGYRPTCTD